MKIKSIITSVQPYHVGVDCVSITEHSARGEGDRWYYDIKLPNGNTIRTFDFKQVVFEDSK